VRYMVYKLHHKHLQVYLTFYYEYLPKIIEYHKSKKEIELKGSKGGKAPKKATILQKMIKPNESLMKT